MELVSYSLFPPFFYLVVYQGFILNQLVTVLSVKHIIDTLCMLKFGCAHLDARFGTGYECAHVFFLAHDLYGCCKAQSTGMFDGPSYGCLFNI